ncbi:hypothetical protein B0H63DRAFT_265238 [Podospora didyma]|uniref:Transporter n=1 Tax=Podospora didyma TaxID=330526 RepID=A0AAE0N9H7_9PEZI|nr:hypothetical protein B0H63DRAFT_265238 [Podospora didyma]
MFVIPLALLLGIGPVEWTLDSLPGLLEKNVGFFLAVVLGQDSGRPAKGGSNLQVAAKSSCGMESSFALYGPLKTGFYSGPYGKNPGSLVTIVR